MSEAKECDLRILTLAEATTDLADRVVLPTGLAEISADYGRRDEALRFLTRARAIDLPEFPRRNAMKGPVIAACAKLRLFDEAHTIADNIPDSWDRARDFIELAEAMTDAGLKDQARSALSRAHDAMSSSKIQGSVPSRISRGYAEAYARLWITVEGEACDPLNKIVNVESVSLPPDESEKRVQAEQVADRFIKRWHETLDLNVLFDEMFVTNKKHRRTNGRLFYYVYQFLTASSGGPAVDKNVDDALMREAFFAFWNVWYSTDEYRLCFQESEAVDLKRPPELESLAARPDLDKNRMSRSQVERFVSWSKGVALVYRKYLTASVFDSPRYLKNLANLDAISDKYEERFRIARDLSNFDVPASTPVYNLRRGIFYFYFIEENGKLKVLTLGFNL